MAAAAAADQDQQWSEQDHYHQRHSRESSLPSARFEGYHAAEFAPSEYHDEGDQHHRGAGDWAAEHPAEEFKGSGEWDQTATEQRQYYSESAGYGSYGHAGEGAEAGTGAGQGEEWQECYTDEGHPWLYNHWTGESRWGTLADLEAEKAGVQSQEEQHPAEAHSAYQAAPGQYPDYEYAPPPSDQRGQHEHLDRSTREDYQHHQQYHYPGPQGPSYTQDHRHNQPSPRGEVHHRSAWENHQHYQKPLHREPGSPSPMAPRYAESSPRSRARSPSPQPVYHAPPSPSAHYPPEHHLPRSQHYEPPAGGGGGAYPSYPGSPPLHWEAPSVSGESVRGEAARQHPRHSRRLQNEALQGPSDLSGTEDLATERRMERMVRREKMRRRRETGGGSRGSSPRHYGAGDGASSPGGHYPAAYPEHYQSQGAPNHENYYPYQEPSSNYDGNGYSQTGEHSVAGDYGYQGSHYDYGSAHHQQTPDPGHYQYQQHQYYDHYPNR